MFPTILLIALPLFTDALRLVIKEVSTFAPDLPMYYYHIPSMTGVACKCSSHTHYWQSKHWLLCKFFRIASYRMSHIHMWKTDSCSPVSVFPLFFSVDAADVLNGIEQMIPSFQGVKYSGTDLRDLGQCVCYSQSHNWSVMFGVDEVWNPLTRSSTAFFLLV